MPTLSITKNYADGDILLEADLDAIKSAVETFLNSTKIDSDNLQTSITYALAQTGSIIAYAGSSAPSGWLLCYGQAIDRTTYADLFSAIGTNHGTGNGSTTFNLPDLRGRAVFGKDDMGGSAASRVTSGGSGITGTTLGAAGGTETVTLTSATMPSHTHSGASSTHYHEFGHNHAVLRSNTGSNELGAYTSSSRSNADMTVDFSGAQTFAEAVSTDSSGALYAIWTYSDDRGARYSSGVLDAESGTSGADARTTGPSDSTTGSAGSDGAHNNMPPTLILNYIIKI